jgi:hypothetical protein
MRKYDELSQRIEDLSRKMFEIDSKRRADVCHLQQNISDINRGTNLVFQRLDNIEKPDEIRTKLDAEKENGDFKPGSVIPVKSFKDLTLNISMPINPCGHIVVDVPECLSKEGITNIICAILMKSGRSSCEITEMLNQMPERLFAYSK